MQIITTNNSKLGGQIAQVNMPVGITCREDAPCFNGCYARKGHFVFPKVRQSQIEKYEMYKKNPKKFFEQIDAEMSFIPYKYFRWHSSGDIPDLTYLKLMCWLARRHKETRFLCFTKKWEIADVYFQECHKPSNLIIVYSAWKDFQPVNPHNFPTAWVDFGDGDENIPEFAYECTGSCADCPGTHCWHMHKGDAVVFHKH